MLHVTTEVSDAVTVSWYGSICRDHRHLKYCAWSVAVTDAVVRVTIGLLRTESHYQKALALAEELGMRPLQAHCHLGLGTLYGTLGRREQARVELSVAMALYRAMDMTSWLPQAEAALAQVEATSAPQAG
jgi:hypothetical protein